MICTFRPNNELKEKLKEEAKKLGIPLNSLLIIICNEYFKRKEI